MGEVPVTETQLDRQRQIKELNEKINSLKSVRETEERKTKLTVEAADQAVGRLEKTNKDIETAQKLFKETFEEIEKFIQFCDKIIRESMEPMDRAILFHKKLIDKCDEADSCIKRIEKAGSDIHEQIVKDMDMMSTQAQDLSIYRSRLEKYFKEHLPDQQILL